MVESTKDRGNFKRRKAIEENAKLMYKIKTQKTISTGLVLKLINSKDQHSLRMERKYQKLANQTNLEIQLLRKQIRALEAELAGDEVSDI